MLSIPHRQLSSSLFCQEFKKAIPPGKLAEFFEKDHQQLMTVGEEQILVRFHPLPCGEQATLLLIYLEPDKPSFSQKENKVGLTRREMEVVNLLSQCLRNAEISAKLFISDHTVENHLKSVYQKLGVRNRTGLIQRLTHSNWPNPERKDDPTAF
jgi:DNA-binding CsgD family transcriptional regulator